MLLAIMQAFVAAMAIGTIATLASMENSEVLARIRKLEIGKVIWTRSFITKILLYGLLPALSVAATLFPSVGSTLSGWLPGFLKLLQ